MTIEEQIRQELKGRGLTAKQELFIITFLQTNNATQSARQAGYGAKGSTEHAIEVMGSENLKKLEGIIDEIRPKIRPTGILTIEERKELLSHYAKLGKNSMDKDIINVSEKAIDLLNKMDGLYNIKIDVNHNIKPIDFLQPVYGRLEPETIDVNVSELEVVENP